MSLSSSLYQQFDQTEESELYEVKKGFKQKLKEFKCYFWINFIQFGIEFDRLFF